MEYLKLLAYVSPLLILYLIYYFERKNPNKDKKLPEWVTKEKSITTDKSHFLYKLYVKSIEGTISLFIALISITLFITLLILPIYKTEKDLNFYLVLLSLFLILLNFRKSILKNYKELFCTLIFVFSISFATNFNQQEYGLVWSLFLIIASLICLIPNNKIEKIVIAFYMKFIEGIINIIYVCFLVIFTLGFVLFLSELMNPESDFYFYPLPF